MWIIPKNLPIYRSAQDTEALISDSSALSDMLEQSVMWRSKLSSSKTWSRRLKRDSSIPRLSTQTLKPSLGNSLVGEWTSSVEASLVSHFQPLECEEETKIQDTSGPTSQTESNDWEDLPLFSSRMLRESSVPNLKETIGAIPKVHLFCSMSLENWKGWVTAQRQEYSQRVKSAHLIKENESLSWVVAPISESRDAILFQNYLNEGEGKPWPTPNTSDSHNPNLPHDIGRNYLRTECLELSTPRQEVQSNTLGNHLEQPWATPNTMDYCTQKSKESLIRQATTTRKGRTAPANLREQVNPEAVEIYKRASQWATPMSGSKDHLSANPYYYQSRVNKGKQVDLNGQVILDVQRPTSPAKLNPRWVETLMGLPVGWTMPSCVTPWIIAPMNSVCWGTESYQPQPQELSESFGDLWSTPPATQRGDTIAIYLRKSLNRILGGAQPFAPTLQVSVALDDLGLSTSPNGLFYGLDLSKDIEVLIHDIISRGSQK